MKTLSRTCVVAGCASLLIATTGAAAANAATVTAPEDGTLLADGAAVSLSVTFDCEAGWTGGIYAKAAQTVRGHRLATGSGFSTTVDCVDGKETVEMVVLGDGDFAFAEGDAVVEFSLFTCGPEVDSCESIEVVGQVRFEDDSDH